MGKLTIYKPIVAKATDLPLGFLNFGDEETPKLRFIVGSVVKQGYVIIVTDNPMKPLGDITYLGLEDEITVYVPSDLNDPEVYSNIVYHLNRIGRDIGDVQFMNLGK